MKYRINEMHVSSAQRITRTRKLVERLFLITENPDKGSWESE